MTRAPVSQTRAPAQQVGGGDPPPVRAWSETLRLPTYLPEAPSPHPLFLERRVYQGSRGSLYPLPASDRIAETAVDRDWKVVGLENRHLRVLILPELGGRIHALEDRRRGCDLIYRQPVIKPALVGLAGPWISGGIEFNWPQHHRPATFLPVEVEIEHGADGSVTVWCGDHEPMARMKGMHGVCLHPDRAALEIKVRVSNRTPFVQTFLWWTNIATRVHEAYQSFLPPDVHAVADHARRSMSRYPLADGCYYGVDYGARARGVVPPDPWPSRYRPLWARSTKDSGGSSPAARAGSSPAGRRETGFVPDYPPNDLSWYANIPTPCSYMATGSRGDFLGGYDHRAGVGIVHVAPHAIAPGKKQWTWGNHEFGHAWDRNLTDPTSEGEYPPYIELMAGVYTDNQPDFSFLMPGETRSWSQFLFPIHDIGPVHAANRDAALRVHEDHGQIQIGICVTRKIRDARVVLTVPGGSKRSWTGIELAPGRPFQAAIAVRRGKGRGSRRGAGVQILDDRGREILAHVPRGRVKGGIPEAAREPPPPARIRHVDVLYLTGLHLDQYRHATRCPTLYWREALRRDPDDSRCNHAMGLWHLRRGEFHEAEAHFRRSVARWTQWNSNPADGEPLYSLGICLRFLERHDEAHGFLAKATWNQAWASAGFHALAEIDCRRGDWELAEDHLRRSLRLNADNARARSLRALVLGRLHREAEAAEILRAARVEDPLDWWTRHLLGEEVRCDLQIRLDIAHDFARAGFHDEAVAILRLPSHPRRDLPDQNWGAEPIVHYTLGWLLENAGAQRASRAEYRKGRNAPADYCFPSRLEEIAILQAAMRADPSDGRAPFYLGNLLQDRRRHEEAIRLWERSARLDPANPVVWRNLGMSYFNTRHRPKRALAAYDRAFAANPADARVLFERDQLWKRMGVSPRRRLAVLLHHEPLVRQRDDLAVEVCALLNQTGRPDRALSLLSSRRFQPWEGGEGQALAQYVASRLALGREALEEGRVADARLEFQSALTVPEKLGEARHPLANTAEIHYWLGCALDAAGDAAAARESWRIAAQFVGDFQEMRVCGFSELTYYSALAWRRLGRDARAHRLFRDQLKEAHRLRATPATIDYFATSLPNLLLFDDDLARRREAAAAFLEAQAWIGLGKKHRAIRLLERVLELDPNHARANAWLPRVQGKTSRKTRHPEG